MAEFGIVDLSVPSHSAPSEEAAPLVSGQSAAGFLGNVDTAVVASALESLREDLAAHIAAKDEGLRLASVTIKLTLTAEGKVAFVAKGSAEACIEVVFATPPARGTQG
jgi:hypothetical protein